MLNVGSLTSAQSANIFLNSQSVQLLPVVAAEWNQNLFNTPYCTVAGTGVKETVALGTGTVTAVTGALANPYFTTNSFALSSGAGSITYNVTTANSASSYKAVFYMKTNNPIPVMANVYGQGTSSQFGSTNVEINSYSWTKIELFVGGSSSTDAISSFVLTIACNILSASGINPTIYYTVPEVYQNQYFNYQYNSLWDTDSVFSFFRPGESYVGTGNSTATFPSTFRQVNTQLISGYSATTVAPVSSILENPNFSFATQYVPLMKNVIPTDISSYKYFVSDTTSNPSVTGIYQQAISTNKIVVKFNTLVTVPAISIYLNGSGTASFTGNVPANGVLVLYYNGTSWSTTQWSTQPQFNSSGTLSPYTTITKITVTQTGKTINSQFSGITNTTFLSDSTRMHLIEISPRLEIDLTSYVEDVEVNKALDSKSTVVPLSTITSDDATVTLAGMPAFNGSTIVPLFSNQSNKTSSVLANLLRKNIKLYIGWNLVSYSTLGTNTTSNTYIPGGVFYCDSWDETDIESVKVQAYDAIRYLQTLPAPDYVANLRSVFDIISNILDLAGFTDYDVDSLYSVCNDPASPLDMSYFYVNSKDTTIAGVLTELFLAYQIGCYIDEYGIMKFLSLSNILSASTGSSVFSMTDAHVEDGGYSVSNSGKVGKISLRYQSPKIKQSLSLQNATDPTIKNSPSFIYTTSNDQVWMSGSTDSVGFNYLNSSMGATDNRFKLNVNDFLDIFHTFDLNNNGYVAVENEIMSFSYKEYTLSNSNGSTTVSVKNSIELASEINKFIKKNQAALQVNTFNITGATVSGTSVTYNTSTNNLSVGQSISIDGASPASFNLMGTITAATTSSFTITSNQAITDTYSSGGVATVSGSYNVTVTPTGYINNVQRGMFGTVPAAHNILSGSLSSKSLSQATVNSSNAITSGGANAYPSTIQPISTNPALSVVKVTCPANTKVLVYPTSQTDIGYKTYSTKFNIINNNVFAGGIFFNMPSTSSTNGTFFVEFIQNQTGTQTSIIQNADGTLSTTTTPIYQYIIAFYKVFSGTSTLISWADVTGLATNIVSNFENVLIKNGSTIPYSYAPAADSAFQLKVVHYTSDGSDGEVAGEVLNVFMNNYKVVGWQVTDTISSSPLKNNWMPAPMNSITGIAQNPSLGTTVTTNSLFGAYMSTTPVAITGITYNAQSSTADAGTIRELYATQKALIERSTNYWHQDSQFLNGLVQNQRIFAKNQSYMMQTTPTALGINHYDVQYQNPAATNVDILPIQYYMAYYPGNAPIDNAYKQELLVDEYSLSYSTPIHTGFRAKFAIANNSPYMVFIHHQPDELNQTTSHLVLWTHEIVAQSDPEVMELVLNSSNSTEVAQIDSNWVQSKSAATRMLGLVQKGIDGFSKDTSLRVFGNPLIQLGDIITFTYPLTGVNAQQYVVHSVKHGFKNGLSTDLVLNSVGPGTAY